MKLLYGYFGKIVREFRVNFRLTKNSGEIFF